MKDFLKKILGNNWMTTLSGVGVLVFVAAKCILSGGQFFDCIQQGYNIAFVISGAGLIAAKDSGNQ